MSRKPQADEFGSLKTTGHGSKFGRKKEEAITALLTQRNVEEAARAAGIGTRTLIRWLKIPEFEAAYLEARRAAVSQSNARLQQGSSAAVSTLLKVMVDASTMLRNQCAVVKGVRAPLNGYTSIQAALPRSLLHRRDCCNLHYPHTRSSAL
jgi:hypothetical protein